MRVKLKQLWSYLNSSLWFLPFLIIILSIGMAVGAIEASYYFDLEVPPGYWRRLLGAGADGSRELLGAISNSMIAIASVTFSITILVLSQVAAQYSPRILRNFMRSTTTQLCMGAFIGTFVYSIIVLRSIESVPGIEHVPSLAILLGLLLGIVSVAVLVFFIHHIATSIQASVVISEITTVTLKVINHLYPDDLKREVKYNQKKASDSDLNQYSFPIPSKKSGYIQNIDSSTLLTLATGCNSCFIVKKRIGDFVVQGEPLLESCQSEKPDEEVVSSIRNAFAVGQHRTIEQDVGYGVRQLVDIALKALSPSLNDTTNAVMCLHHIGAILSRLVTREIKLADRYDTNENLRVISRSTSFASFLSLALDQIRLNSQGNLAVAETAIKVLGTTALFTSDQERRRLLEFQTKLWIEQAYGCVEAEYDVDRLTRYLDGQPAANGQERGPTYTNVN